MYFLLFKKYPTIILVDLIIFSHIIRLMIVCTNVAEYLSRCQQIQKLIKIERIKKVLFIVTCLQCMKKIYIFTK